jgi:hypothetical protein
LIYLHQTSKGFTAEKIGDQSFLTFHRERRLPSLPESERKIHREIGLGAQILSDLNLKRIRILTNHPRRVAALEGFDIEIVEQVPVKMKLGIEEDFFINYGFVTPSVQALMHPRPEACVPAGGLRSWPAARRKLAQLLLAFVRERGAVHPREVDEYFAHGTVRNYWGGSSNATTHLLDAMHYRGMLRVVRRERGIRIYAAHQHGLGPGDAFTCHARIDALVDIAVRIYAPLPGPSLSFLIRRLRFAAPQWQAELAIASSAGSSMRNWIACVISSSLIKNCAEH